jgi:hypothetical protein
MNTEEPLQSLEREIRRLEETFTAEIDASRRASRTAVVASCVLGGVIAVFVLVNLLYLRSEWTREKLTASLRREVREFTPKARYELELLGEEVVPVFVAEARSQLHKEAPAIVAKTEAEVDRLIDNVLSRQHRRLAEAQERVLAKAERNILEAYPNLKSAAEREALGNRFHATAEDAIAEAVSDFNTRFGHDVHKLKDTLLRFDLSDSHEDVVDLQKKFLHLWLQLLDEEIVGL